MGQIFATDVYYFSCCFRELFSFKESLFIIIFLDVFFICLFKVASSKNGHQANGDNDENGKKKHKKHKKSSRLERIVSF